MLFPGIKNICCLGICFKLISVSGQPIIDLESPAFISGLTQPLEIVNADNGSNRLYIVEKVGIIKVRNTVPSISVTEFLNINSLVTTDGERGLLSLAFHPNYETNGYFYVYYTDKPDGAITIARYQVSANPNVANTTGTILLRIPKPGTPPFGNHNGGHLQFRTEGGVHYLYFATGDGGSANDPFDNAQNSTSKLGKMIRIDVDNAPASPQIWALGLRNPFRWSFDRLTMAMWIGDVGQGSREEVSYLAGTTAGYNFGWDCYEGTIHSKPSCNPANYVAPVFEYTHSSGQAITGGYVYRGNEFPALKGYYITADYYSGIIWLLNPDGSLARTQAGANDQKHIAGFGEAEDGTLYVARLEEGTVEKIITESTIPLPVSLSSFTVKQFSGFNELRWSTLHEQDVALYIIEYSTDGRNFQPAGEVVALNNSNGYLYDFKHYTTEHRKYFYRLKTVDKDGRAQYSRIISLGGVEIKDVIIYPTVLRNNLLELNTSISIDRISVFGSDGRQVFSKNMNGMEGYFSIQLPALARGIYLVNLKGKNLDQTEKIIIQ